MGNLISTSIIALATPSGPGALALIRLSGNDVYQCIESMVRLSSGRKLTEATSHTIHHGIIIDCFDRDRVIDEVLFFVMHGPRTFTGEDTLEISCHNNELIINAIIECAIIFGARLAEPGEFSRRAVLNGKMDLLAAEGIREVLAASSQAALKGAMASMKGSLSAYLLNFESDLL
ncbi:MAG TPA: tRNA uridine-5-carboxymethylaminomethyl(34) synthesis GTPase MnmE, partial [Candidatus Babeliales bacterium]|nr:tRNA uridine-5-carboxymethylaminomethyl(34) synthesis GTPase MnmE [Candidatus Babeliales bacterium]